MKNIIRNSIVIIALAAAAAAPPLALAEDASSTPEVATTTPVAETVENAPSPTAETAPAASPTATTTAAVAPAPSASSSTTTTAPQPAPDDTPTRPRDTSPPVPANLSLGSVTGRSVVVSWAAPYDDSGTIARHDVRLSRQPLGESTWDTAIQFPGAPSNVQSGETTQTELSGLPEGTQLYIAIRAADAAGNMSPLSNVVSVVTKQYGTASADAALARRADVNGDSANFAGGATGARHLSGGEGEGTVRVTVVMPNGLPSDLPIYVNFINTLSGQSYGGPTVNGLASYKIPAGDYYARLAILDTRYEEPKTPVIFHLDANEDKNVGRITLVPTSASGDTANLTKVAESTGGIAKLLLVIIRMLGEILQILMKTTPQAADQPDVY